MGGDRSPSRSRSGRHRKYDTGRGGITQNGQNRGVRFVVVVIRLLGGRKISQIGLQRCGVGLAFGVLKFRDRNRRKNADDYNHNQKFDQCEAAFCG